MRYKDLIILLLITFIFHSFNQSSKLVKFVYDGDTILIDSGEKIRYLGVDAPEISHKGEKDEYMAGPAKAYNTKLVKGKRVRLEFDREIKDHYGRLLAYVFLENGEMVNALLVRKGYAHILVNKPNLKYFPVLLKNQRSAMAEGIGIWNHRLHDSEEYYWGSKKSYRFHKPGCPFSRKISHRNRIRFDTKRDAFWAGFSPCRKCRP